MNRLWFTFLILLITSPLWAYNASNRLCWNANSEADLAGYGVHVGNLSGNYNVIPSLDVQKTTTPTAPCITLGSLKLHDGTYYTVVSAYDNSGNRSGYSSEVRVPLDQSPPVAVGGVRVE